MTRCAWAACAAPAYQQDTDGYLHCRPHWREHLAMESESIQRVCAKCSGSFVSRTPQRKLCDDCRKPSGLPAPGPCPSHAAYVRHKSRSEQPCQPCVEAERAYHRDRYLKRRAA